MPFVHLRSHSEYSVVDGTVRIDDLVKAAAKDGQPAVAVTDLSNLFGALKLYKSAQKKGVQPIIGADVWVEPEEPGKAPTRLLLLIQNRQGYLRLSELLGEAWTAPGQRTHAWVHWASLVERNEGLICLSGAEMGLVGQALSHGDVPKAEAQARKLAAAFPNRFYIELQRSGHATNEPYIRAVVPLAAQAGLAGGGHPPDPVPGARRFRGARGTHLHCRGRDPGQSQAHQALHARAVFQDQR
jgi:DNA polymerase-3 subunit alpha